MATTFVLTPGFWLGGWAWDRVIFELAPSGTQCQAVTLPGLEPELSTEERARITLTDQIEALAEVVQSAGPDVVLVAHSGAGTIASGVLDQMPEAVRRMIYVDSGPAADGAVLNPDLPAEVTEIPLPAWEVLAETGNSLDGLGTDDLDMFRARAVPEPAGVVRAPIRLHHLERRAVPTTIIASSMSGESLMSLADAGHPMFAEVAALQRLQLVDLPTGHWPMWSKPAVLAETLLEQSLAD